MQRQAAFTDVTKHLKGALHCHTTRSDGAGTPEEVLALHKENGYDFVTLTDHRVYNFENFGVDGLTIIPGTEWDVDLPGPGTHCHHIVVLGAEKKDGNPYEQDERLVGNNFFKEYSETQRILDQFHEENQMTVYCHPEWSGTPAREFEMLRGNFAMEIWNTGAAMDNDMDTNASYWDELLVQGQKIYGVATDDGHGMDQHCKGWVMVNAKDNSVASIREALKAGAFYSSCGPEIHDFYIDDENTVHVECSPVVSINIVHLNLPYYYARPENGEETITSATFSYREGRGAAYVRAVVKDAQGRRAWSNPIFVEGEKK